MLDSFQLGYVATYDEGEFLHLNCDSRFTEAEENYEDYLVDHKAGYIASGKGLRYGSINPLAGWYPDTLIEWIKRNPDKTDELAEDMVIRYTIHEAEQGELANLVDYYMEDPADTVSKLPELSEYLLNLVDPAEDEGLTDRLVEEWLYDNLEGEVRCGQCGEVIS